MGGVTVLRECGKRLCGGPILGGPPGSSLLLQTLAWHGGSASAAALPLTVWITANFTFPNLSSSTQGSFTTTAPRSLAFWAEGNRSSPATAPLGWWETSPGPSPPPLTILGCCAGGSRGAAYLHDEVTVLHFKGDVLHPITMLHQVLPHLCPEQKQPRA